MRFSVFVLLISCLVAAGAAAQDRPNILFCIADDWGWPHASAYGDAVVKTPTFDRVAREGVLFRHAYVASPSCTPSRNAILTGQYHWRLDQGANLWSSLSRRFGVYPLMLEARGYHIGHWRKSWGPGRLKVGGYIKDHPAGKRYPRGFKQFLDARPDAKPFCFWLGASDPHRGYAPGSGRKSGMDVDQVEVPAFYPDVEQIRSDIADYYFEVQRFDSDVGKALALLESRGELENTVVVVTGDHGMPFPRCKSNLYDMGVRVPLAVRWGAKIKGDRTVSDFVSLVDLAPTFLEIAGVEVPSEMNGRSLVPILTDPGSGRIEAARDHAIYGKERHVPCRPDHSGYPCRGIRTDGWAYIRNVKPDRWPVGDPPIFGDTDPAGGPGKGTTKTYLLDHRADPKVRRFFDLSFSKRPREELYDMTADPDQLRNLAADPRHAETKSRLAARLEARLRATADPRVVGGAEKFDRYPYYGGGAWKKTPRPKRDPVRDWRLACEKNGVVGSAVLVQREGQTTVHEVYGHADLETGRKVDVDTIFHWASITKTLTGVAIMQLRDRGLLKLDDPILRWVPELREVRNPHGKMSDVTLRHLLSHGSGFRNPTWPFGGDQPWHPHEPTRWDQLVAMMPYTEVAFTPGEKFSYSNLGIIFLGRVIEKITGDEFEVYIEKNVFKPLGMTRSYFDRTPWHLLRHRSNNYRVVGGKPVAQGLDFDTGITVANGGWNAPLGDLARWTAFLAGQVEGVGASVLSRESLREMWRPHQKITEALRTRIGRAPRVQSMGLSFFLETDDDGLLLVGHTGSQRAFITFFLLEPSTGTAAIAAFNTDGAPQPATRAIMARLREGLQLSVFPRSPTRK